MGGTWFDEPPFASQLRAAYDTLITQSRLRAGAKKQYHTTPRKPSRSIPNPPEPTFDLVGGALDAEAMFQVDKAYLGILRAKVYVLERDGQLREAEWVKDVYRRRAREVGELLMVELRELTARLMKAEARFAQGFTDDDQRTKAEAGLDVIVSRHTTLMLRVQATFPSLIEGTPGTWPEDPDPRTASERLAESESAA